MRFTVLALTLALSAQAAWAINNPNSLSGYEPSLATPAFTQALRTNNALYTALSNQPLLVARLMTNKSLQDQLANGTTTVDAVRAQLAPNSRAPETAQADAPSQPQLPSGREEDGPALPLRPGVRTDTTPPTESSDGGVRVTTPPPAAEQAAAEECYSGGPIAGPALTIPYCPGYQPEAAVVSSPTESTACYNGGPIFGPGPQTLPNCPEYDAYLRAQRDIAAVTDGTRTDVGQTAAADIAQGIAHMQSSSGGYVPMPIYDAAAAALAEQALTAAINGNQRNLTKEQRSSLRDINAIPQTGNDKNGWPAYLEVPKSCALPDENRTYLYTPYLAKYSDIYRLGDGSRSRSVIDWIKALFVPTQEQGLFTIIDKETYAIPFYAPNADTEGNISFSYSLGKRVGFDMAIASCPDQFETASEQCVRVGNTGSITLSYHVDDNPLDDNAVAQRKKCELSPGKLYYLNVRINPESACGLAPKEKHLRHYLGDQGFREGTDGEEYIVCNRRFFTSGIDFSPPPYTGPGVSQDPHPINYFSGVGETGMAQPFLEYLCKNSGEDSRLGTSFDMVSYCADPQDLLTPALYQFQCRNNLSGWVGERKTAYNTYVCEQATVNAKELAAGKTAAIALADLFRTPRKVSQQEYDSALCAKHREGQIRELRCVEENRASTPQGYRQQQCQYVPEAKRYLWVNVDIDPAKTGLVNSYPVCVDERANQTQAGPGPGIPCRRFEGKQVQCGYHIVDAPVARESCSIFGKKFALGTQRIATCGEDTLVHECRSIGEARHTGTTPLPSFVYVSGASNINPDVNPERCSFNIGSAFFPVTEKPRATVSPSAVEQEPSFGPSGGSGSSEEPSFGPGGGSDVTVGPGSEEPSFGPGGVSVGPGGNTNEEPSFGPGGNAAAEDTETVTPPATVENSSGGRAPAAPVTSPSLPSGRQEDGPPVRGVGGDSAVRTESTPLQNGRLNGGSARKRPYNHQLDQK